jgi:hypothetical protein
MPTKARNNSTSIITIGAGVVWEAATNTRAALAKMHLNNLTKTLTIMVEKESFVPCQSFSPFLFVMTYA